MGYPNTREGALLLLAGVGGRPSRWRLDTQILTATAVGFCRYQQRYLILLECPQLPQSWTMDAWWKGHLDDRFVLPGTKDNGTSTYINLPPDCLLVGEPPLDLIDPFRYPHSCPTCKAPAYIGAIRHIACSNATCVHAERS